MLRVKPDGVDTKAEDVKSVAFSGSILPAAMLKLMGFHKQVNPDRLWKVISHVSIGVVSPKRLS